MVTQPLSRSFTLPPSPSSAANNHHLPQHQLRIVVVGTQQVGKTALVVRFLTSRFIGVYDSKSDCNYQHNLRFDDMIINLHITDTSGQKSQEDQLRVLREEHVYSADGFIVVYSICNKDSYTRATQCVEAIGRRKPLAAYPVLVLGNQTDMAHMRAVSMSEAEEFCGRHKCLFYEVSAAESATSVMVSFHSLITELRLSAIAQRQRRRKVSHFPAVFKLSSMFTGFRQHRQNTRRRKIKTL